MSRRYELRLDDRLRALPWIALGSGGLLLLAMILGHGITPGAIVLLFVGMPIALYISYRWGQTCLVVDNAGWHFQAPHYELDADWIEIDSLRPDISGLWGTSAGWGVSLTRPKPVRRRRWAPWQADTVAVIPLQAINNNWMASGLLGELYRRRTEMVIESGILDA